MHGSIQMNFRYLIVYYKLLGMQSILCDDL